MRLKSKPHSGQTMTEYILLIGLIALACIAAVKFFGKSVKTGFEKAGDKVQGATEGK